MNEYGEEVRRIAANSIDTVSKEAVKRLKDKSASLFGGGRYSRGWTIKRQYGSHGVPDVIIHNKTDYQLTHLLEFSHVIRNQYGEFGRTSPHPHIKPVEEWANKELVKEIEREL